MRYLLHLKLFSKGVIRERGREREKEKKEREREKEEEEKEEKEEGGREGCFCKI